MRGLGLSVRNGRACIVPIVEKQMEKKAVDMDWNFGLRMEAGNI